jgi:hypothetical protein
LHGSILTYAGTIGEIEPCKISQKDPEDRNLEFEDAPLATSQATRSNFNYEVVKEITGNISIVKNFLLS